jgi:hypothetical protein
MTRNEIENAMSRRCEQSWLKRSPFVQGLSEEEQTELLAADLFEVIWPRIGADPEFAKEVMAMGFEIMVEEELARMQQEGEIPRCYAKT